MWEREKERKIREGSEGCGERRRLGIERRGRDEILDSPGANLWLQTKQIK